MSSLKKLKDGVLHLLRRLYAGLSGWGRGFIRLFFPARDAQQADKPGLAPKGASALAAAGEQGERKKQGKAEKMEKTEKPGGLLPRNYLPLAGAYVLALILLAAVIISKQGQMPGLQLPGKILLPNKAESGLPAPEVGYTPGQTEDARPGAGGDEKTEAGPSAGTGPGAGDGLEKGTGARTGPETGAGNSAPETAPAEEGGGTTEAPPAAGQRQSAGKETAGPLLPKAASPLSTWQVSRPFGDYIGEALPSGGMLHTMTRGASLAAAPGAPVAALWEGRVGKIGGGDSSYGRSVVLKHSGGYITFYGNLREVWVEEGDRVSRGEHLGLLPHYPPVEAGPGSTATAHHPVAAAAPAGAAATEAPQQKGKDGGEVAVPLKTIHKGMIGGEMETSAWPFAAGNPLLYLEVRQGHSYLDPLSFIGAGVRN